MVERYFFDTDDEGNIRIWVSVSDGFIGLRGEPLSAGDYRIEEVISEEELRGPSGIIEAVRSDLGLPPTWWPSTIDFPPTKRVEGETTADPITGLETRTFDDVTDIDAFNAIYRQFAPDDAVTTWEDPGSGDRFLLSKNSAPQRLSPTEEKDEQGFEVFAVKDAEGNLTGERFFVNPETGTYERLDDPSNYGPNLDQIIAKAFESGDFATAQAAFEFKNQPTNLELLDRAIAIAQSPIDQAVLSQMARGLFDPATGAPRRALQTVFDSFGDFGLDNRAFSSPGSKKAKQEADAALEESNKAFTELPDTEQRGISPDLPRTGPLGLSGAEAALEQAATGQTVLGASRNDRPQTGSFDPGFIGGPGTTQGFVSSPTQGASQPGVVSARQQRFEAFRASNPNLSGGDLIKLFKESERLREQDLAEDRAVQGVIDSRVADPNDDLILGSQGSGGSSGFVGGTTGSSFASPSDRSFAQLPGPAPGPAALLRGEAIGQPRQILPQLGFTSPSAQGNLRLSPTERGSQAGTLLAAGVSLDEQQFERDIVNPASRRSGSRGGFAGRRGRA